MNIIIASSGAGGHLVPALKVAHQLKQDGHSITFVGSFQEAGFKRIQDQGYNCIPLNVKGFTFVGLFNKLKASVLMCVGILSSLKILKKIKPRVVFGFGGYGSVSIAIAARMLKVPLIIHEQNVIPGRANALLAKYAQRIAISFKESFHHFNRDKTVLTGCPCHHMETNVGRKEILKEFGLEDGKPTIFVLGGSQGSHRINTEFLGAIQSIEDESSFQVIHVCGQKDFEELNQQYQKLGRPYALFRFLDRIHLAYTVADLVISRAGAVTITEIASYQLPALLIPYPFAGAHQIENAKVLSDENLAQLIEEKDLTKERIKEFLLNALKHQKKSKDAIKKFESISFPDAAKHLAKEAVNLVHD